MIRCRKCKAFTSNNRCWYNTEQIVKERGDCWRCGKDVPLESDGWDSWFPPDFDPYAEYDKQRKGEP